MYILAVDDEYHALNYLIDELNKVFPGCEIHGEQTTSEALKWAHSLKNCGELRYAFLDIQMAIQAVWSLQNN